VTKKTYDIITVDWFPEQTAMWKHYIEKNSPRANIITIPQDPPVKWSKFSCKMRVLQYEDFKHQDRIMYMDTDCLVLEELEPLFEFMELHNYELGASRDFLPSVDPWRGKRNPGKRRLDAALNAMGVDIHPPQYSSGMLLFTPEIDRLQLYEKWLENFEHPAISEVWGHLSICEEIALSYAIKQLQYITWHLPREVHGNIVRGRPDFGKIKRPMVVHYHKFKRLQFAGLLRYYSAWRSNEPESFEPPRDTRFIRRRPRGK